jgi:glycogen synthase
MLYVLIENHHYFYGREVFTIHMEEFWFLFNMDAVDISFVSCWTL